MHNVHNRLRQFNAEKLYKTVVRTRRGPSRNTWGSSAANLMRVYDLSYCTDFVWGGGEVHNSLASSSMDPRLEYRKTVLNNSRADTRLSKCPQSSRYFISDIIISITTSKQDIIYKSKLNFPSTSLIKHFRICCNILNQLAESSSYKCDLFIPSLSSRPITKILAHHTIYQLKD